MKKRVLAAFVAFICVVSLLAVPVQAYAPSGDGNEAITYSDTVRWYYRMNNGVKEMRLWSITQQKWLTGWIVDPNP